MTPAEKFDQRVSFVYGNLPVNSTITRQQVLDHAIEVYGPRPPDTSKYACHDCGTDTLEILEYYMVYDNLWQEATEKKVKGCLCIGCLETRLGRQLTNVDFINAPVNSGKSLRLQERLGMAPAPCP
jgi:hypothetical protein